MRIKKIRTILYSSLTKQERQISSRKSEFHVSIFSCIQNMNKFYEKDGMGATRRFVVRVLGPGLAVLLLFDDSIELSKYLPLHAAV